MQHVAASTVATDYLIARVATLLDVGYFCACLDVP